MKNLTSGELSWQDPIPTAGNKGDHFDCQQRHNSEEGAPQLHKTTCTDRKHPEKQPCSERQSQSITNSYFVLSISEKHVCCEWLHHFSGSLANNAASQHHTTYTQIISPLYRTQGNFTTLWGDIRAYFLQEKHVAFEQTQPCGPAAWDSFQWVGGAHTNSSSAHLNLLLATNF